MRSSRAESILLAFSRWRSYGIFVQIASWGHHPSIPDIGLTISHDYHRLHVHLIEGEAPERGQAFPLAFAHCLAHNRRRGFSRTMGKDYPPGFFKQIRSALAPRVIECKDEIGRGCSRESFLNELPWGKVIAQAHCGKIVHKRRP